MPCLNCRAPKTIDAHLIPKTFINEVKAAKGEQHLILRSGGARPVVSNTGAYDRDLLCGACDSLLGGHECYVVELLRRLRKAENVPGRIATVDGIDGDRLVRFAAGIAWKYANTTAERGRINVGSHVGPLRDVALRDAPIPASIDLAIVRLVEAESDLCFYRAPLLDRNEGLNTVRFSVGGFLFFLKIDKRRNGSALPAGSWLRGRTRGSFLVARAEMFEEGRLHLSLGSGAQPREFFGEMRARQGIRARAGPRGPGG